VRPAGLLLPSCTPGRFDHEKTCLRCSSVTRGSQDALPRQRLERRVVVQGGEAAERVAGRDVVVIQDTSELALGGRRAKANGYGPVGKGGALRGLLLHAVLAVDAGTGGVLGLVDAKVWNRKGGKVADRRSRATPHKESQRWLNIMDDERWYVLTLQSE